MPPRPIVRDPSIFKGKWRIEGTLMFVADIRRDHYANEEGVREAYRNAGLTAEELDAVLSFEFPPVRDASVQPEFVAALVHCVCGESTRFPVAGSTLETPACLCGRTWRTPVGIEPGGNGRQSASPDSGTRG